MSTNDSDLIDDACRLYTADTAGVGVDEEDAVADCVADCVADSLKDAVTDGVADPVADCVQVSTADAVAERV